MRALAAIVILALSPCCAYASTLTEQIARALSLHPLPKPVERIISCAQTLGPIKCLNAMSVWRAKNAIETITSGRETIFNLTADAEQFPWERYSNTSHEQLYSQLCDETDRLMQYRALKMDLIPNYKFELQSKGNGTLSIDIFRNNVAASARGKKKKLEKMFYKVLPFLLMPGLIMSAILPFVLPSLKMMVMNVGMLNNMALTGAIFTLMRNNAFSDSYKHKILYVNEGYKNEKKYDNHVKYKVKHHDYHDVHIGENDDMESQFSNINTYDFTGEHPQEYETFQEEVNLPNANWVNHYYTNDDDHLQDGNGFVHLNSKRKRKKDRVKINPLKL